MPDKSGTKGISPTALLIGILVASLNFGLWAYLSQPSIFTAGQARIGGLAYSGFQRDQNPSQQTFPSEQQLDDDLKVMAAFTTQIRTYTSTENADVPRLAARHGLRVTAGAWLDTRLEQNDVELAQLISSTRENRNIDRVIVGNESVLRGNLSPAELIGYLKRVRKALCPARNADPWYVELRRPSKFVVDKNMDVHDLLNYSKRGRSKSCVPVSTAEPWHVWLKYPELVRNVDFITVHLLPFWEGVPVENAVEYVLQRYRELQQAYPRKRIVIGEVGWPSNGIRVGGSVASTTNEAQFIREFLARTKDQPLDYYLMEAFDQPWKMNDEGWTGGYWGMFDAFRQPKFPLQGPVIEDTSWWQKALAASLLALLPMCWFAGAMRRRLHFFGKLFFCVLIQAVVALTTWLVTLPFDFYLRPIDIAMMVVLLPALAMILMVLLSNGFEFAEVMWNRGWLRGFAPRPGAGSQPFVSIHLPCCNEPPEMVIATLQSLAHLDYENFEVLVIDNNTKNEALWQPVRDYVADLGPRFRFFHLEKWPGFKAGALNFALRETDTRAEVIGVVDADYVVERDWLSALVAHFEETQVAVVQSPQAHRDFEHSMFQRMCNFEFEGFFKIGMHHRNERNAIIQHGTMTLIRRSALVDTGNWAEWCICEDAELGLRLMHAGYETRYIDTVFGRGLAPASFKTFKAQRFRWAFGAMQILKRHRGWLMHSGPLSAGQRYHFLTGWGSWFADALHLVFSFAALAWTAAMLAAPATFSLPLDLFMIPTLAFFVCKASFGPVLYRARVDCSWRDLWGAALASMGLSHTIACGVIQGLIRERGVFLTTAKGNNTGSRWRAISQVVREEALMAFALLLGAASAAAYFGTHHREAMLWTTILVAQSLPYLAAIACAIISARPSIAQSRPVRTPLQAQPGFGTAMPVPVQSG